MKTTLNGSNDKEYFSLDAYCAFLRSEFSKAGFELERAKRTSRHGKFDECVAVQALTRKLNVVSQRLNNPKTAHRAALDCVCGWVAALQFFHDKAPSELVEEAVGAVKRRELARADRLVGEIGAGNADLRVTCDLLRSEIAEETFDYERALALAREAMTRDPANSGGTSAFASIAHDLGQFELAVSAYTTALTNDIAAYGQRHPNVAVLLNNLGVSQSATGAYEAAIACYERALTIDLAVFGEDHPSVAIDRSNLASAYRKVGDIDTAIAYYEFALRSDLKSLGPEHPQVATDYNNLGSAWQDKRAFDKAIQCYAKALESDEISFGKSHPQVATCLNNTGTALRDRGDKKNARVYFDKALVIFTECLGPHHANTKIVQRNLADLAVN